MGCLSASLGVYSTNFAKILRSTWIWVLALSVVLGLATFVSPLAVLGANGMGQFAGSIAAGCLIAVASVVLDSVVKSNVVVMLNDEKRGVAFKKMLKVDVFSIVLFAVCLMVFAGSTYLLMSIESVRTLPASTFTVMLLAVYLCLFMLLALLVSPYIYSVSKYIFNKDTKFKNLVGSDYAKGYKKLGFVFSILLLLILVGAIVCAFLCLPGIVTNAASNIDTMGVMQGDETGIPTYFGWLNFLATTISTFIIQYVCLWGVFVFVYAYGNVEASVSNPKE
ncbi:hypothetical protein [uncultured Prevotella sp.]|uniref:hypothetical protein n=1 Tax=uncultured Prevotella sp. TaxID=159272 RepID=UPI0027E32B2F|nr:hypothetical protein [uncultured Prevotella sp.]